MDIECDAGCGVLPFHYRDQNLVNALQWCVGLELFLLIEDPWRVFLTTDHPNGAPFTTYPHLIRLLMDKSFRRDMLATIHKGARALSALDGIDREYSLYEIAIVTRAGPARILGIHDRHGHLGPGALADVTVYEDLPDREKHVRRARPAAEGRPARDARRRDPHPRPPRRHPCRPPRLRRRDHAAASAASSRTTATCGSAPSCSPTARSRMAGAGASWCTSAVGRRCPSDDRTMRLDQRAIWIEPLDEGDCGGRLCIERPRTADERTVPKIKSQDAVRILRNADPDALPDLAGRVLTASEPQRAFAAQVEPVEPTIDPQRRGQPARPSRQVAQALDAAI